MSREVRIDLFCEDHAHEQLLRYLVLRVCREFQATPRLAVRSARGGRGKAISELVTFQRAIRSPVTPFRTADLFVIGVDVNCRAPAATRDEIMHKIDSEVIPRWAIAFPDPHVERWYLVDTGAFNEVVGFVPEVPQGKCTPDFKRLLSEAVVRGGHPPTLGGIEFASDLVESMDLRRAERSDKSFKHFVSDLRSSLRAIMASRQENVV